MSALVDPDCLAEHTRVARDAQPAQKPRRRRDRERDRARERRRGVDPDGYSATGRYGLPYCTKV